MKKTLKLFGLLLAAGIMFMSCQTTKTEPVDIEVAEIILSDGTWEISSASTGEGGVENLSYTDSASESKTVIISGDTYTTTKYSKKSTETRTYYAWKGLTAQEYTKKIYDESVAKANKYTTYEMNGNELVIKINQNEPSDKDKTGTVEDLLKPYKYSWVKVTIKTNSSNTRYDVVVTQDNFAGKKTTKSTFIKK